MNLKDIKPVATLGGQPLFSAEQMQEYVKIERDYILVIDGGFGTKIYAKDRFTGVVAVDIYGDKYKVMNHVTNGKKWVLQEKQDEEV